MKKAWLSKSYSQVHVFLHHVFDNFQDLIPVVSVREIWEELLIVKSTSLLKEILQSVKVWRILLSLQRLSVRFYLEQLNYCNRLLDYMALSHKDWELPNSWIWLAETDIVRGLDFPI